MEKLKVLHCPLNCGNQPWNLSRAERKLGFLSDVAVIDSGGPFYPNAYDKNFEIKSVSLPHGWKNLKFRDLYSLLLAIGPSNEVKRIKFLQWALKNYDVFHFNSGATIWDHPFYGFNHLDLPLIKKAKKKIVVTYTGEDARQKDYFTKHFGTALYGSGYSFMDKISDWNKRLRIRKVDQFADAIFALNPDLMAVLPARAKFMPYASVDIGKIKPIRQKKINSKVTILHAPSIRRVKGTNDVIRTFKKLAKKYPIELVLVENLPHKEAIKKYATADIVIDQLKVGWYGGFAVEAMAYGLPVISYLRQSDLNQFVPFKNEIPIVNADGKSLEKALIPLIENVRLRKKIGQKSREYVEKYHDPLKLANEVVKNYQEN